MDDKPTDKSTPAAHSQGKSLEEVHSTVETRHPNLLKRIFAFAGPAYLVSVGYMDPGNWATDLEGGSRFGYALIWVILMSNMMAVLLQTLAARLGIVTGKDLAQACRSEYSKFASFVLWIMCEIAIAATDLAELLGTILGLNLLFGLPLLWGAAVTLFDTFLLLAIQRLGIRKMEAFILSLITVIAGGFVINLFLAKPDWGPAAAGLGEPVFDKLDAELAYAILSIGAIKGIEFGAGFESTRMNGSTWNDPMRRNPETGRPQFLSNHAGGILGGISTGTDIVFDVAVKPVSSISLPQKTIDINGNDCNIEVHGRHDVCLCPRIVPVIEAMTALVIADMYLRQLTAQN